MRAQSRHQASAKAYRHYRAVRMALLSLVLMLAGTVATFAPRAETPAPAPQRHTDAMTSTPVNANSVPSATLPRDATATGTATPPTHPTATPSTTPTVRATTAAATATATPNPVSVPAPHIAGPENHPRITTRPAGTPATGTVGPLPSRHPDATIPPMANIPLITRADVARGIQYTSWWHGEYASTESDLTLAQTIVPLGANWIGAIVTCYSQTITDTVINCAGDQTPTDADLTHLIAKAHTLGLKVMLKPHVDLFNDPSRWRGEISMTTNADWALWFSSYQVFITHYAALAQTTGAEMFAVGTELEDTSGHAAEWRAVVTAVRRVYTGPITYASNHGGEVPVTWWDALDFIGVDAYYPLTTVANPTLTQLKAAWAPTVTMLGNLSANYGKPVLFTEVGYQSQAGTNITPWKVTSNVLDVQEQANCYTALLEVFRDLPWWRGVFWWSATPYRNQGGLTDMDFTPINKPAQDVLRLYYGGIGAVSTPRPIPGRHP